jgi:hypothetical protein
MLAGRYLEVGADGVGFDTTVAFDHNSTAGGTRLRSLRDRRTGPNAKNNNREDQAGHDQPSSYSHTHFHAQSALNYPVAAPRAGCS